MNQMLQFLQSLLKNPLFRKLWVFWKALTASWRVHLEKSVPVEEVAKSREAASIPSFGFFFLLISATILATLGLLANSTAVIIGAMIVAPLMNPILSMSFGVVTGNWTLYKRSLVTVLLGIVCAILVSYWISALLPVSIVRSEIMGRTSPNLIDLGIAIAAGAAGSFSLTRQSIASSIAGVAIAVALVPPLCVVGIGLGIGDTIAAELGRTVVSNIAVSQGAFLLFLANWAGITVTACIIFLSQSYGGLKQAYQKLITWVLIMALLIGPLSNSLQEFFLSNHISLEIYKLKIDKPEIWQRAQIRYLNVDLEGSTAYVTLLINAPEGVLTDEELEDTKQKLFESISSKKVNAMDFDVRIIPVQIRKYQSIAK